MVDEQCKCPHQIYFLAESSTLVMAKWINSSLHHPHCFAAKNKISTISVGTTVPSSSIHPRHLLATCGCTVKCVAPLKLVRCSGREKQIIKNPTAIITLVCILLHIRHGRVLPFVTHISPHQLLNPLRQKESSDRRILETIRLLSIYLPPETTKPF